MKKAIFVVAAVILTAALAFSGFKLWEYYSAEQEVAEQYEDLTEQVVTPPSTTDDTEQPTPSQTDAPAWTVYDQYGTLFGQNADMIGWIKIDGTSVDYPVMQTPDRPDFYLKRGFDGKYSDYGVPYAAEGCSFDPQSDNITIFGHHMKSGKMFGILESYKSKDFYLEHPTIRFDTKTGFGVYEILAVFKVNPADFPYHKFISAADQADFDGYVSRCKALSFYDTGVTAQYGDKLITLSTCEYSAQGNRLVVVAKRIGVPARPVAWGEEEQRNEGALPLAAEREIWSLRRRGGDSDG